MPLVQRPQSVSRAPLGRLYVDVEGGAMKAESKTSPYEKRKVAKDPKCCAKLLIALILANLLEQVTPSALRTKGNSLNGYADEEAQHRIDCF